MTASPHLLVVDRERATRALLFELFGQHGFRVSVATTGAGMWRALEAARIDLVVLGGTLPGEDGPTLCRRLRARASASIIMLTATDEEVDRIRALEMGADDCIGKPFSPRELAARVNAVLRRNEAAAAPPAGGVLSFEGWRLDTVLRQLYAADGTRVRLSSGAFDLLVVFAEHAQRVLSQYQLLGLTSGRPAAPFERSVDMKVGRLRRKIESNPRDPVLIRTVRGRGYMFAPPVTRL